MSALVCSTKLGIPKAAERVAIRAELSCRAMAMSLQDVQNQVPTLHVSLSRVGVTNVEKVIRISAGGTSTLFSARLDCFVDLGPRQKGAHMSRFEEVVNDAIGEVILTESAFRAETLAQHIAEKVRDRQGARRAEVRIEARYPEQKPAPGERDRHAGDLHAARGRRGQRGGHPPAHRRHRPGHDGLPVRADVGAGRLARTAAGGRLLGRRDRAGVRRGARRHPQPARAGHAPRRLPGELHARTSTPSACSPWSRTPCRPRSTS